jgi:hypothetical protein
LVNCGIDEKIREKEDLQHIPTFGVFNHICQREGGVGSKTTWYRLAISKEAPMYRNLKVF